MKPLILLALLVAPTVSGSATDPQPPLATGHYVFQQRFAEHPSLGGMDVKVIIQGAHIVVVNPRASDPFPAGVLAEGELLWHPASRQWIIGHDAADRAAPEVGGCSDGPEVIDLSARVYWTC